MRIREILNRVQNEVLGETTQLMRVKPDPFFATTDETYSYAASSSIYVSDDGTQGSLVGDIRTVKDIYSWDSSVNIFDHQTLDYTSPTPNQIRPFPTRDRVSQRIDVQPSINPNSSEIDFGILSCLDPAIP